jgi:hypothetical protein
VASPPLTLPRPSARRRAAVLQGTIAAAAAAALAAGLSGAAPVELVAAPVLVAAVTLAATRLLLGWTTLLSLVVVVIIFIPIRRYSLPGALPFELEPYRLLVALVMAGWGLSLLADRRVHLRRTGLEGPLVLFGFGVLGSLAVNAGRISELDVQTDVVKGVMFFASFFLVLALVVSVVRTSGAMDALVQVLVVGGSVLAVLALYEARTGYNLFDHLHQWLPGLELQELPEVPGRGARLRVYSSAQHPIALGAAFAMLLPLSIYLAQTRRRRHWWLCLGLLAVGAVSTVSRTSIVMLLVVALIFLWLRPRETRRLWPALVLVPVLAHLALPGAIGSLHDAFFPTGGLVEEQSALPGYRGSGRIADLGPSLAEWRRQPFLGQGFGTRVTDVGRENARILDNQWLGSLLEMGLVGVVALAWLFLRAVRRFGRMAKVDSSPDGWLLAAVTAAVAAYAISMFTYDAFSFVQVTFLLFILLGLGAGTHARLAAPEPPPARAPVPAPSLRS